jgi:hypothetical protein
LEGVRHEHVALAYVSGEPLDMLPKAGTGKCFISLHRFFPNEFSILSRTCAGRKASRGTLRMASSTSSERTRRPTMALQPSHGEAGRSLF